MVSSKPVLSVPGLQIAVGQSTLGFGLGLFLTADAPEMFVPAGTLICKYADGQLTAKNIGDKTLYYTFSSPKQVVYVKNCAVTLEEALRNGMLKLFGHKVYREPQCDQMKIEIDPWHRQRHYVPSSILFSTPSSASLSGPSSVSLSSTRPSVISDYGCYINDFAFKGGVTHNRETYDKYTGDNLVDLVWKMSIDEHKNMLLPKYPVVVTNTDLLFDTYGKPVEIGTTYGWDYWEFWR